MIGRTLSHYRILGKLGEGGMGVVYLAEDVRLQRRVALKFLPEQMAHDPRLLRRFEREARLVAALNHPNIVTLYSVEESEGQRFLTMEYVEGKTLDKLKPAEGFGPRELLRLAVPLTDALAAAHARGITHRDLKPGNVMVTPEGRVKVLDFGLAKLLDKDTTQLQGMPQDSLTREGRIIGTLAYMAPELMQGRPPDPRADVFALGIVLYEMATGVSPFQGASAADLISAVLRDQPAAIDRLKPELPNVLGEVIERCLQKAPEARFQSAAEVRDELERAQHMLTTDEMMKSRVPARPLRSPGAGSSKARWLSAGAALLALLLAGAGWYRVRAPVVESAAAAGRAAKTAGAADSPPALVVLPLANFSAEPEYFVDGMTDGLIASLAKIKGVRVISRQSAMHYKGSRMLLSEIAEQLGVDFVVEGSVARQGDNVRLSAQMVRADPETTLWSDTLERPFADTAALHNAVATALVQAAGVELTAAEQARLAVSRPVDPEVYRLYLEGRFHASRFSEEAQTLAQSLYERVIARDPQFAPAWAGLADSLIWQASFHVDPMTLLPEAEKAAARAIELDESLAEGHAALGELLLDRWQWQEAEDQIRRAVELDPNSTAAHRKYWMVLACLRRFHEAREHIERAAVLDPVSAPIRTDVGVQKVLEKRYPEAIVDLEQALQLDPSYAVAHLSLWLVYHDLHQDPERGQELRWYVSGFGYDELLARYDEILAAEGYPAALSWVAHELERGVGGKPTPVGVVAGLLAMAGEEEKALAWLERGYQLKAWELAWLAVSPDYQPLYDQPAFRRLIDRLGLPQPPA